VRLGGNFSASPLYAAGRIYFSDERGKTTVVEAAPEHRQLAVNRLDAGFMASPAVSGNALFLRTKKALYRIEEKAERASRALRLPLEPVLERHVEEGGHVGRVAGEADGDP
jgi:hypothetical protein